MGGMKNPFHFCRSAACWAITVLTALALPAHADDTALWATARSEPQVVLVMRHTATGPGNGTVFDASGQCQGEVMLSPLGRAQAQAMGEAFRANGLPPERLTVVASSMCRMRDTAQLAFGKATLEPAFKETFSAGSGGLNTFMDAAEGWIRRHSGPGPLVLMTHLPNIDALTGEQIEYGDVLVTRADASAGLTVIGRLRLPVPR